MQFSKLVSEISDRTGISSVKVNDVLDALIGIIYERLSSTGSVEIPGLGVFKRGHRKARINKDGFQPAKATPRFIASKRLRKYMEGLDEKR